MRGTRFAAWSFVVVVLAGLCAVPAALAIGPGDLDSAFGIQGVTLANFGPGVQKASAMVIQPDGKYVLAGSYSVASLSCLTLARFNDDGSLDVTFGTGGKVVESGTTTVYDMAYLSADGSFVVASQSRNAVQNRLAHYLADGTRDMSFGVDGVVALDAVDGATGPRLAVSAAGRLLVAETVKSVRGDSDLAVLCLNADGSTYQAFGTAGQTTIDVANGSNDQVGCIALTPNGRILVGGVCQQLDGCVFRLTADGQRDQSFGSAGIVVKSPTRAAPWPWGMDDIAVQTDGSFVVLAGGGFGAHLVRYLANGSPDPSFGTAGVADVFDHTGLDKVMATKIALQSDGKVVVAGTKDNGYPTYKDAWLMRVDASGHVDLGFGKLGTVVADFGGADDCAAVRVDASWRIVVAAAGRTVASGAAGMGVARFLANRKSNDTRRPTTRAFAARGTSRTWVGLKYRISDPLPSSGYARVTIEIKKGTRVVRTIDVGVRRMNASLAYRYRALLGKGLYTWRVRAVDVAGNKAIEMTPAELTLE